MRNDKPTQSIESADDHRTEPSSSASRRGFLRKATTVGLLGITGLTAAAATAEPARAAGWRGPYRMSAGESRRFDANISGEIRIEGRAPFSSYTLIGKNPDGWRDVLRESNGTVEPGDDLDNRADWAFGEVRDRNGNTNRDEPGFIDQYSYLDSVSCAVDSGIIDVFNKDHIL